MKKNILMTFLIIILVAFIIFVTFYFSNNNKLTNISNEDRQDLMKLLDIDNSSSFLPTSINKDDMGLGDYTKCYTLKFEISI